MYFYEKCCKTIDVNQLLSPLKTYSLRFLNVLFAILKCTLYNSQMYSLQLANVLFTICKPNTLLKLNDLVHPLRLVENRLNI